MTLRAKLLFAQAPLWVALALVGVASVSAIAALGRSPELILRDNYRSVLAAERMLAAEKDLEELALARAAGRLDDAAGRAAASARFETELQAQEGNITEGGESQATRELRDRWTGFQSALEQVLAAPARLDRYFDAFVPAARELQRAADEILAINQDAMQRKSDQARRSAERTTTLVVAVTVVAVLAGLLFSAWLMARLLQPLAALSHTVRRIGEGDLDVRAPVAGKDEIAALGEEFNTMAERLRHYRSSSLGELLQAQQASQAAIDSLPDPVLVLDAEGGILNLNGAAEAVLRLGSAGVPPALTSLDPALRAVVDRVRAHVLSGKGAYVPRGFEEAVRVAAGEGDRHLLPRATPLYSEQGGVAGVTIVLQDVTRLMRFDELKNDLVATVAHEFRTPLTSLRMAVHLCAEEVVGPLTEKQADLMAAARHDCERLQGIVDDLLDLSRIQSGRMALKMERLDAGPLLAGAVAEMRSAAEAAQLELAAEAPEGALEVHADPERAQLVLTNLIANAVRHTPPGGRIDVRATAGPGAVRFEVRDTGEGIAREHLDRIFEKFYRVPGARSGAVGIGLYISREIVEAHGGAMGVESEPGRGSSFWFTLPAAGQQPAAA